MVRRFGERRIDILTQIEGISFSEAWPQRIQASFGDAVRCSVISLADLIVNKRAAGRPQALADVSVLERNQQAGAALDAWYTEWADRPRRRL